MDIFCPNKHLILDASTCPKCGWQRPISGTLGKSLWGPVDLLAGLGGESRDKFANMLNVGNTLLLALRSNEMIGVSLMDGRVLWRVAVPVGKNVVTLTKHLGKPLVVFQDTHSLTDNVECGCLQFLDPENGDLTPMWAAPSHDLTAPLYHDGKMFIRTAESKLYCLDQDQLDKEYWHYDLQTWFATPPVIAAGQIMVLDGYAMFGEYKLVAVNVEDGRFSWEQKITGIPSKPLVGNTQQVFVLEGKKSLLALDALNGEQIWQQELSHIYAPPVADDQFIYLVDRGNTDPQAEDHYVLQCLRVKDAELVWQQPLSARARLAPLLVDDTLLIADDHGILHAKRAYNGETLWENSIGHKEDPIQTQPYLVGNLVVVGTYFGKLVAITVKQTPQSLQAPETYLKAGEIEAAAAAYALQDDYLAAAKLYDEKLGEFEEALQLYEKAHAYKQAARLAFEHSLYSKALENYRKSDDPMGEAETLLRMGNTEGASKILRDIGDIDRAAQLMEEAGNFKHAAQFYREAGSIKDYLRLITKTMFDISELEKLRASGNYETAAHWSIKNGEYLEAAKDFREAGKEQDEFEALKQYMQNVETSQGQADPWVWQRLAELGEGLGDLLTAAEAWLMLDRPEDAGDSYFKLANSLAIQFGDQLDRLSTADKDQISDLYQQAAKAYQEAGLIENEERCLHQVRRFQQLPKIIIIQVESKGFRELEWNMLTMTLQNIGFGRAAEVAFNIGASRFEIQEESRRFSFNLGTGITRKKAITLRPNEGHYGERVPLEIEWQWKDSRGRTYSDKGSVPVQVLPQRDTQTSVPVVYQFQNVENFVDGTQIQGDQVAQKGDRVVINRGGGLQTAGGIDVQTDEGDQINIITGSKGNHNHEAKLITCPNCGETISSIAKCCIHCQWDMTDET